MFKKLILALALALPMSVMAQKFGVVDTQAVFAGMPESTEMQKEIQDLSKQYEDELQKLQEQVNKLYNDYQAIQDDPNTAQSIKERRMQEIQEAMQKAEQFRNTASQEIEKAIQAKQAPIQTKINDAVKAVGTEGGYTLILPNEPGLLLYVGSDVTDVTKQVQAKIASVKTPAAK